MAQTINMNSSAQGARNESPNGTYSQSFVTPWGTDPERYWERPDYVKAMADTMMQQIMSSLAAEHGMQWHAVMASWGCVGMDGKIAGKLLRWREMPALALHVNGYKHTGWVVISLNEGADVYELELTDEQMFAKKGSRLEEVYFDELGPRIDKMVETGEDMAAYEQQVAADPDNAEVLSWRERFPNLRQVVVI